MRPIVAIGGVCVLLVLLVMMGSRGGYSEPQGMPSSSRKSKVSVAERCTKEEDARVRAERMADSLQELVDEGRDKVKELRAQLAEAKARAEKAEREVKEAKAGGGKSRAGRSTVDVTEAKSRTRIRGQQKSSIQQAFDTAHSALGYENPLFDPASGGMKFAPLWAKMAEDLIDYRVDEARKLWHTVSEAHWEETDAHDAPLPRCTNGIMFPHLDSSFLFMFLRHFKPARVIEVGAGESTTCASKAFTLNREDDPKTEYEHVVIEPYRTDEVVGDGVDNVTIVNQLVQQVDLKLFDTLEAGDLLFLDNSHVIQIYGDVLHEVLLLLPRLKPGVFVHFHDMFLPYDYPASWVRNGRQYTEQWLVLAFLYGNPDWEVIWPARIMMEDHPDVFEDQTKEGPRKLLVNGGSLYLRKIR